MDIHNWKKLIIDKVYSDNVLKTIPAQKKINTEICNQKILFNCLINKLNQFYAANVRLIIDNVGNEENLVSGIIVEKNDCNNTGYIESDKTIAKYLFEYSNFQNVVKEEIKIGLHVTFELEQRNDVFFKELKVNLRYFGNKYFILVAHT
ncbi:hypothetical protein A3Q56_08742 [Intoshia linei]|uniref:Uncharacterized protein n=1 Tax=Intoshia linei TaxID=1819745 RepID=A0A177ANA5_9BILA|nr:hypothetical protein A3Q56_08742 [Intoshia linei]